MQGYNNRTFFLKKEGNESRFSLSNSMERGNFVVHLKRNFLGGLRPFGNEMGECGLTRFTFRCPNTVGNFLEWSVPDYEACSTPHDKSNVSNWPLFILLIRCIAEGDWFQEFSVAIFMKDFIETFSSFSLTLSIDYRDAIS